jgi:single stranded DNA-binding protein
MPLPQIVMEGRLVDDPELRYTQSGKAVVNVRVVANNRIQDKATGEWKDGDSIFLTATCWDTMAENVAECLPKGALVTLSGRLRQREWDDKEGAKHTVYEEPRQHRTEPALGPGAGRQEGDQDGPRGGTTAVRRQSLGHDAPGPCSGVSGPARTATGSATTEPDAGLGWRPA